MNSRSGYTILIDDNILPLFEESSNYKIYFTEEFENPTTWEEVENQQEAENMHKYVNTLSFDRSVNLWAEAAKKDEDLDPVKGNKTLTKKTQEKITINPMEKQALRHG